MQRLECSCAILHIYIYVCVCVCVFRRQRVNMTLACVILRLLKKIFKMRHYKKKNFKCINTICRQPKVVCSLLTQTPQS